ncbi:MAG: hypothetical protein J7L21_02870 [Sulfurimonas sp.]|nr:hypothetical protein [Sulfurimonas sp.]
MKAINRIEHNGEVYSPGAVFEIDEKNAEFLKDAGAAETTVEPEPEKKKLEDMGFDELKEEAVRLGIDVPSSIRSKTGVIELIEDFESEED